MLLMALTLVFVSAPAHAYGAGLRCTSQMAGLKLCGARTDNYKDCYNTPDNSRERRSWLSWYSLQAGGASYRIDSGAAQFSARPLVHRVGGNASQPSRGYLTVAATTGGNVRLLNFRNDPATQMWGVLLELRSVGRLRTARVRIRITLHAKDGRAIASTPASYRYDAALATAGRSSPEHNGPGGRWFVNSLRTRTDAELGARHDCS